MNPKSKVEGMPLLSCIILSFNDISGSIPLIANLQDFTDKAIDINNL